MDRLEQRRVALAGAISQARFQSIAATSPDGIVCVGHHGRITFWNTACERLFGYSADEAVGADIDIIVPARMRSGHHAGMQRITGGGKPRIVGTTLELDAVGKDGVEFPIELSLSMWREGETACFGGIIRGISDRRANETRLFDLAHHDSLTALPNRSVLLQRIAASGDAGEACAILLLDLDGFKNVNDTRGHTAGDLVLRQVATRIVDCVRPIDTVARLGGDEFAILMPGRASREVIERVGDALIASLSSPYILDGTMLHIGASIGIACGPSDGKHAEDLLSAADMAMYQAKGEGRNRYRFFRPSLRDAAIKRRTFEGEIRRALDGTDELVLFYQPQVSMDDGALLGVEALLRWQHPKRGLLNPKHFLPTIEDGLFASEVGARVLEAACADAVTLRGLVPGLVMGVNLFGAQFHTERLADEVGIILTASGLPPEGLELEITENIVLRQEEAMLAQLHVLRKLGVGIAFDDFGTGYASLSLLKRFPLTRLKIDRSFVRDIFDDEADAAVVSSMTYLAKRLGIEVVAEGIETRAQHDLLRVCGCDIAQGYLYGRPMPLAELRGYITERNKSVA